MLAVGAGTARGCAADPEGPSLPCYTGPAAYAALPVYVQALQRLSGQTAPPYDPVRMAASLGVPVSAVPTYDGARGLLVPLYHGGYRILVRATETPGAQRFTVAHELMELGLQRGCPSLVARSTHDARAGRAKEHFCEVGAAELLMPLVRVRAELQAHGAEISALLALSTLFGTSLHAMLRRLVEAAPTPCLGLILQASEANAAVARGDAAAPEPFPVGRATPAQRHETAAPLRVRAVCRHAGFRALVPDGTLIGPESVLVRCHRSGQRQCAVEYLALGRLQGRFQVEAVCPGRGPQRHVYALLHPCWHPC